MRKGIKLGKCPNCHKKGLIKQCTRIYISAYCRYCGYIVKPGKKWGWDGIKMTWLSMKGREQERKILDSF